MLWLVKIWRASSCGRFMQHLETCLLIAEADRVLCHLVMLLTAFLSWMYKIKYSCYQDSSVIHGWFVYCAFGWEMHRLSKSLRIRFLMASFSKMSWLTCSCSRLRGLKSLKRLRPYLMAFRNSIFTGKPEQLLSLMCFFSGYLKSSLFMRLVYARENDLTYDSIRLKEPLDTFWPQIQIKRFENILVMILAVKRKLWAILLPWIHLEK